MTVPDAENVVMTAFRKLEDEAFESIACRNFRCWGNAVALSGLGQNSIIESILSFLFHMISV